VHRRRFLSFALTVPTLSLAGCRGRRRPAPPGPAVEQRTTGPGRVLDATQWETLRAACARLIPTDQDPGATEANVVNFIDAQLATPHVGGFREEILAGLRQLDVLARRAAGTSFAAAPAAVQDQALLRLQRGMRLERRFGSRHCFQVLLTLTLEGFLGHPLYGGNHDLAGWRCVGFQLRPPHPRRPYGMGA